MAQDRLIWLLKANVYLYIIIIETQRYLISLSVYMCLCVKEHVCLTNSLTFLVLLAQILELPSKLFYKNRLTCKAVFPPTGPKNIPAIKFIGVDGKESQEEESPSFYNDHEVTKIVEQVSECVCVHEKLSNDLGCLLVHLLQVQQLVSGGLRAQDVCVVSYYQMQVFRLRYHFRQKKLSQASVCV